MMHPPRRSSSAHLSTRHLFTTRLLRLVVLMLALAGAITALTGLALSANESLGVRVAQAGAVRGVSPVAMAMLAGNITVNSTIDVADGSDGKCTLREAITAANTDTASGSVTGECVAGSGDDAITFDLAGAGPHLIQLVTALPNVITNVSIGGPTGESVEVRGEGAADPYRILTINPGLTVRITDLTITSGFVGGGGSAGGIYNNHSNLTLSNCTISGNAAANAGGGIVNDGSNGGAATLTIINSTISGNTASSFGSGIFNGGFQGTATLTIINSTISGNTATSFGGGIYNSGNSGVATLTIINSTISGNSAASTGGGIYNFGNTGAAPLTLSNTIISDNTALNAANGPDIFNSSGTVSGSYNLIETTTGYTFNSGSNNIFGVDPMLGPLADNGGPTRTHALLPGSPAIDAGSNALAKDQNNNNLTTDQRGAGFPRIVDSPDADTTPTVDIGSFEVQSTLQLTLASYTVSEANGHATITVTRTGDLSSPASVNYETSDISGLNNCDVVTGNASQRCDYTALGGTLSFIAGQSSASFDIPIIDDVYVEGSETLTITLSNPTGGILSTPFSATLTITDNDNAPGAPNPIAGADFFIRMQYLDILNREPDPPGFAGWQAFLNNCAPASTACDRVELSSNFFRSPEFFDRAYYVYRFYDTALGRKPTYDEYQKDLRKVAGFLTEAELEQRKAQFAEEFSQRADFKAKYDSTLDGDGYVNAIVATAGVTPSNRTNVSIRQGALVITRGRALRELLESPEISQRFFNEAFVVVGYFAYLRREPDAQYLVWLNQLNTTGNYRDMIQGFIESQEYRHRFGP